MALEPITREEKYLAKAAGQSVEVPEPITRKEMFLDAVAKRGGGSSGGGAQPDWNANDGEPGHVLNRTHYAEKVVSTFVDETLRVLDEDTGAFHYTKPFSVYAGEEYTVSWDGIEYKCICIEVPMEETTLLMLGNAGAVLGGESTGEPFLILADRSEQGKQGISERDTATIAPLDGSTHPHVKITGLTDTIHELAPRYIATEISAIKAYIDTKAELAAERANVDISEGEHKQGTLSRFFCEHIERGDRVKLIVRIDEKDYYFLPQFYNVDGDNVYRANIIFNTATMTNSVGNLYCLTVHINMSINDDSSDAHYILEKLHTFTAHEIS